ncbi:MAG: hypothetical protein M1324_00260 [Patescibacteria group bacterium]|nr:hypothetical protein [Patescibacteria group bacterium]
MNLKFPFQLKFKYSALGQKAFLYDRDNNEVMFADKGIWRIREKITIYSDAKKTKKLYEVRADRTFSPYFQVTTPEGDFVGSIKRSGRITFKSYHQILDSQNKVIYKINEINFPNGLLNRPRYTVCKADAPSEEIASMDHGWSFGTTLFQINGLSDIPEENKPLILISFVIIAMMVRGLAGDKLPLPD